MTTFAPQSVVCGACGHVFTHHVLASTYGSGSPDLDTRPSELERSTMHAWIQRCPSCGYCAGDVAEFDNRLRPVIESTAYCSQLADALYPELASKFLCAGMLAEAAGRQADAGWAYLHAAWTLDDTNKDELARTWRKRAADKILAILNDGQLFAEQPGASEAIVADCLRRAGRGADALQVIDRALSQGCEDVIGKVLAFERVLIQRGDTDRHLIKEALETGVLNEPALAQPPKEDVRTYYDKTLADITVALPSDLTEADKQRMKSYEAFQAGRKHYAAGRTQEALECFDHAISYGLDKDAVEAGALLFLLRGLCLKELEWHLDAIDDFTAAIRLQPQDCNAFYQRAISKLNIRDEQGSLEDIQEAIRLSKIENALTTRSNLKAKEFGYSSAADFYEGWASLWIHPPGPGLFWGDRFPEPAKQRGRRTDIPHNRLSEGASR